MFASVFFIALFASTVNSYYNKTNSFDFLKTMKEFYISLREEQVVSVKETTKVAYEKGLIVEDVKVNGNEDKDEGKNVEEDNGNQQKVAIDEDKEKKNNIDEEGKKEENKKENEKEENKEVEVHGEKVNDEEEGNEGDILTEDEKKPEIKVEEGEDNDK